MAEFWCVDADDVMLMLLAPTTDNICIRIKGLFQQPLNLFYCRKRIQVGRAYIKSGLLAIFYVTYASLINRHCLLPS